MITTKTKHIIEITTAYNPSNREHWLQTRELIKRHYPYCTIYTAHTTEHTTIMKIEYVVEEDIIIASDIQNTIQNILYERGYKYL